MANKLISTAKTWVVLAVIAGTAFCVHALPAYASDAAGRIAYVDLAKALNSTADGIKAKDQLKLEFKEKQQRLDMMQKDIISMREALDRDRLTLSPEALESREKKYRSRLTEVQQRFADYQREIAQREARLTETILSRIRQIVKKIGEQEGYALILEKSQEIVLYAPGANDITDMVLKEYNRGAARGRRR